MAIDPTLDDSLIDDALQCVSRGETAVVEAVLRRFVRAWLAAHVPPGFDVGIDLSDLGYAAGETKIGLFFQDAPDDGHRVDPVFIAGLPEMK